VTHLTGWPVGDRGGLIFDRLARQYVLQAVFIALAVLAIQAVLVRDFGLTTDETTFIQSNRQIADWVSRFDSAGWSENFSRERLQEGWPFAFPGSKNLPLVSFVSWGGYALAGRFDAPPISWRWGNLLLFSATCGIMFHWLRKEFSTTAALAGLAALLGTPRLLANACLFSIDPLVGCFWILASWALVQSRHGWGWPIAFSVLAGMGLCAKPTFWFAVPVWLVWGMRFRGRSFFRPLICLMTISPLVALLFAPMWWSNPISGALDYLELLRSPQGWTGVDAYYLGEVYQMPGTEASIPWHAVPLLSLVTTPLWVCCLFLTGLFFWYRSERRSDVVSLWAASALILPLVVMLPSTPGHDGVRLFLPSFFFVAMIAGYGFHRWAEWARQKRHRGEADPTSPETPTRSELAVIVGLFCLSVWPCWRIHPGELSYYNMLVGGFRGAAEPVQLSASSPVNPRPLYERTYWWDVVDANDWQEMQEKLPPGAALWVFPDFIGLELLQEWGQLRKDLRIVHQPNTAQFVMIYGRLGRITSPQVDPLGKRFFHGKPLWERRIDGVRVAALFRWR